MFSTELSSQPHFLASFKNLRYSTKIKQLKPFGRFQGESLALDGLSPRDRGWGKMLGSARVSVPDWNDIFDVVSRYCLSHFRLYHFGEDRHPMPISHSFSESLEFMIKKCFQGKEINGREMQVKWKKLIFGWAVRGRDVFLRSLSSRSAQPRTITAHPNFASGLYSILRLKFVFNLLPI